MRNFFRKSFFFVLITKAFLHAEVEEIVLRWNAEQCLQSCVPLLERHLNDINHVINLQMNARSGSAVMGWRPNYPFSYEPFRLASAGAGIRLLDMRIRARGTIAHDANDFYLVSTGDNSRFLLIGPIHVEPGRYVPYYNLATHPLSSQIKTQLLDAELKSQTVIISGPLLLPNRFPRTLIVEQLKVAKKESQMDQRYIRY